MSAINAALRPLFDLLLAPVSGLPAIVGVTIFSLLLAVVALWLVKLTSNSEKVDAAKRKVAAGLMEIRLFNDSLPTIFRAIGSILRHQGGYVLSLLIPFVLMMVVFLPFIAQLQFHWGYHGLAPGDTPMLTATFQEGWDQLLPVDDGGGLPGAVARPVLALELPSGLSVDSLPVWSPSTREMAWRLRAEAEGEYEIGLKIGDDSWKKTMVVSQRLQRLSPSRVSTGFVDQLLYPAEPPLPERSGLEAVAFDYPERDVWFLFWRTHWIIVMLVLSIVFALILRGPMGATI